MITRKYINKTLIASSIATVMTLSSALAIAQLEQSTKVRTYTDPVSGELRVAPKLLSQMTEQEKAALTKEEQKTLKQIEAQLKKEKTESGK